MRQKQLRKLYKLEAQNWNLDETSQKNECSDDHHLNFWEIGSKIDQHKFTCFEYSCPQAMAITMNEIKPHWKQNLTSRSQTILDLKLKQLKRP